MALNTDYKFPLDLTGVSLTNYVAGERHVVNAGEPRLIVFRSGPFFTGKDSNDINVKIYDWSTGAELVEGADYSFLCLYEDATLAASEEIATVIELKDASEDYDVGIDANVIGGEFSYNDSVIIDLLLQVINDNRNVSWDSIVGKPDLFTPSPHMHNATTDLTGEGNIVKAINGVEDAVVLRNVSAITDPILLAVANKVDKDSKAKVGLDNSVWTPSTLTSNGFRIGLPKSLTGTVKFLMELTITGPDSVDEFIISAQEQGSHFKNIVVSRRSNTSLKWAVGLSSPYVGQNTIEVSTEFFDDVINATDYTFMVKGYYVDTVVPERMTGDPTFLEFKDLEQDLTISDVVWPDTDERDFVSRNRNVMLAPESSYLDINTKNDIGHFQFPNVLNNVPFDFQLELEINLVSGSVDSRPIRYLVNGGYRTASKFYIKDVTYEGSPAYPLLFLCKTGTALTAANQITIRLGGENGKTVTGYAIVRNLTVSQFHEDTWRQKHGLVATVPAAALTGLTSYTSKSYDTNQTLAYQKVIFGNGRYRGTAAIVQTNGIKLQLPKLKTVSGEAEGLMVDMSVVFDDGTNRHVDKYQVAWTSLVGSLQSWWLGTSTNKFRFFIGSDGSLEMRTDDLFSKSTIHINAINYSGTTPELVGSYLTWSVRTTGDLANDTYMVDAVEYQLPGFKGYVDAQLLNLNNRVDSEILKQLPRDGSRAMTGELILVGNASKPKAAVPKQQLDSAIIDLNTAIGLKADAKNASFLGAPSSNTKATSGAHLVRLAEMNSAISTATNNSKTKTLNRTFTTLWAGNIDRWKGGYGTINFGQSLNNFDEVMAVLAADHGRWYSQMPFTANMASIRQFHAWGYGKTGSLYSIGLNGMGSQYWSMVVNSSYTQMLNTGNDENCRLRRIVGVKYTFT